MSGKTYLSNKNFFKRNYFEALKYILPAYLYEDDVSETPKSDDPVDLIINSHIDIADNFSAILDVDPIPNTIYSSINTFSSISQFFVKQNDLTNITTQTFEDKILIYFNRKFTSFKSQKEFESFVDNTLLSSIILNNPDTDVFSSIGGSDDIKEYLTANLSWMYFLNTSGPTYDPSSYVRGLLVSSLYEGKPVKINDGINGLTEHVWRNASADYYPSSLFASGERSDLSGTQQLEKLKTWNDIIYSPLKSDESDFRVRDKFLIYLDSSLKNTIKIENGPFARLIRALSFFSYDIDSDSEGIANLYDIEDCPDEYLPLIAELIGWDLFGKDPAKWRLQLRNAVSIYKTVGTKKSIQSTINTVFPKNTAPVESKIVELWESYIPYIIYYSLATNSQYFKNFETWSPSLASDMGIEGYSTSSMDDNIRLAVDKIILEIIENFPRQFPLKKWLDEQSPVFNYRGRSYPIPPFEEYPYYVNGELGSKQIAFIVDRLKCFGCSQAFTQGVSSYITSTAISEDTEVKVGSWLMFASGYTPPPNIDDLIRDPLSNNRFDYASLWCGKSSHFRISFQASSFDFDKDNLDISSTGDAVRFISQSVHKRSPAHSIPIITLEVPALDTLTMEASCLPHVFINKIDIEAGAGNNNFASGLNFNSYKRGINTGGDPIGRASTETNVSDKILNSTFVGNIPRNSSRRRSFEKIMPFNGYYDRTGFNMPVGFDMSSDLSGIPLGLIPKSMTYTPVSSYINLPPVWAYCENLSSDNSYYEYDVSNTQNIRGKAGGFQQNKDRTIDRGQVDPIFITIHKLGEMKKDILSLANSSISVADPTNVDLSGLEEYLEVLNYILPFHITSPGEVAIITGEIARVTALINAAYEAYTASSTNSSDELYSFPNSMQDYYNFEFGRDLHRLYDIYKKEFAWHNLSPHQRSKDGANLFSHTFGPLIYNHDLNKITNYGAITRDFIDPTRLDVVGAYFTGTGSFVASADDSMYVDTPERVTSAILDGVELVLTSGTESDSSFSIVNIPKENNSIFDRNFMYDKTLLMLRSGNNSLARVRYDLSKYDADYTHPISKNFLLPNHKYKFNLKSLVTNETRTLFGGRAVYAWIHTKPESGMMWSHTKSGEWVQHTQLPSREDVLNKYAHVKNLPSRNRSAPVGCIDQVFNPPLAAAESNPTPLLGITESDFDTFSIEFDTFNRHRVLPIYYEKYHGELHRKDQEYVVEVFISPGGADTFMVLDKVEMQNMTMKKLSEIFVTGIKNDPLCILYDFKRQCEEYRIELTKLDLSNIFKFFNDIAGKNAATPFASRDKNKTETIMESEGGSRLDYRYKTDLFNPDTQQNNIIRGVTIDV